MKRSTPNDFKSYYRIYLESSRVHAENVMRYGPAMPFGYPEAREEQLKRVKFIAENVKGPLLDLGSDSGYILNESGGGVGIDISLERIKAAKHWYPQLILVQAMAELLPFKGSCFETVIAAELLEHVLDPSAVLEQARTALVERGRLIVTVPDESRGKSHMSTEHLRKFNEGSLRNALNEWFDVLDILYVFGEYPTWCAICEK